MNHLDSRLIWGHGKKSRSLDQARGHSPHELWGLVARQAWARLRRRLRAGPSYRWRYSGRTPERVLIAPPDLRIADPQVARDIYHGQFLLAGQLVETRGQSNFGQERVFIGSGFVRLIV